MSEIELKGKLVESGSLIKGKRGQTLEFFLEVDGQLVPSIAFNQTAQNISTLYGSEVMLTGKLSSYQGQIQFKVSSFKDEEQTEPEFDFSKLDMRPAWQIRQERAGKQTDYPEGTHPELGDTAKAYHAKWLENPRDLTLTEDQEKESDWLKVQELM